MNDFVNYQKRDIKLPAGCKDLFDLLQQPKFECVPKVGLSEIKDYLSQLKQQSKHDHIPQEGLFDIKRYVSRLMQSPDKKSSVWIDSFKHSWAISLIHRKGVLTALILLAEEHLEPLHRVLNEAAIQPTQEKAYDPNETYTRCILCSLPTDVAAATHVVYEMLRKGFALPEDIVLDFRYSEREPA